jgi:hypothetical protein
VGRALHRSRLPRHASSFLKFSVGVTGHPGILEIEGPFTQGSSAGKTLGESVNGIFEMDSSDWSNGIRYHNFGTRPDTEFKSLALVSKVKCWQ